MRRRYIIYAKVKKYQIKILSPKEKNTKLDLCGLLTGYEEFD